MEPRSTTNPVDAELRAPPLRSRDSSVRRSLLQLATSFGPFLAGCAAMYVACGISPWLALALAVPTGAFMVRVFIVQHDCGHGSFFSSRRANTIVGRLCSLCTFTPFASWSRQHAQHHAEWNNLDRSDRGSDIYSSCLTVHAYLALSDRAEVPSPACPPSVDRQLPPAAPGLRAALSSAVRHAACVGARTPLRPSHQCEPRCPVCRARPVAGLARRAAGSSVDHGRRIDPRRVAVHPAASLPRGAVDRSRGVALCRCRDGRIVLVRPAACPALVHRQYRLPSRPPSEPAHSQLPAARRPTKRPRACVPFRRSVCVRASVRRG